MPLYDRRNRRGRAGAGEEPDARAEVDRVLASRHALVGMSAQGRGRVYGTAILLLFVVTVVLVVIFRGLRGGLDLVLSVLAAGAAGVLVMAAILLALGAVVLVVTAPGRLVSLLRRGRGGE